MEVEPEILWTLLPALSTLGLAAFRPFFSLAGELQPRVYLQKDDSVSELSSSLQLEIERDAQRVLSPEPIDIAHSRERLANLSIKRAWKASARFSQLEKEHIRLQSWEQTGQLTCVLGACLHMLFIIALGTFAIIQQDAISISIWLFGGTLLIFSLPILIVAVCYIASFSQSAKVRKLVDDFSRVEDE